MTDLVDRKSTRLNSSHLVISYAVFCLKKKYRMKLSDVGNKMEGRRRRVGVFDALIVVYGWTVLMSLGTHILHLPPPSYFFFFLMNGHPQSSTPFPSPPFSR